MSLSAKSHVKFKKGLCHPVDFRGQGPYIHVLWRDTRKECEDIGWVIANRGMSLLVDCDVISWGSQ